METGTPYMCYKDAVNQQTNQKNLDTIKSSDLCTEIMENTDPGQVAVCNLASNTLPKFIDQEKMQKLKLEIQALGKTASIQRSVGDKDIEDECKKVEEKDAESICVACVRLFINIISDTPEYFQKFLILALLASVSSFKLRSLVWA